MWRDSLGHGLGEGQTGTVARVVGGVRCGVHRVLQRNLQISSGHLATGRKGGCAGLTSAGVRIGSDALEMSSVEAPLRAERCSMNQICEKGEAGQTRASLTLHFIWGGTYETLVQVSELAKLARGGEEINLLDEPIRLETHLHPSLLKTEHAESLRLILLEKASGSDQASAQMKQMFASRRGQ